ncbi:MAG: peptide chain release factor N(5)-glutamine methyltransferase [Candidatus Magasanikbacteria bacterium]|jgi:release factor glutamine methyltransferase
MKSIKEWQKILSSQSAIDLDILIAHSIKRTKEFIITHPEHRLSTWETVKFLYLLYEYRQGYSVAVITKHKEFYGLDFFVNKHVLIPRPETELMVEEALKEIENSKESNILLIDVGTGSGCIPIAITKHTVKKIKKIAVDVSNHALNVARKNIQKHQVDIELRKSNLLNKINHQNFKPFDKIIITANLPYLTQKQVTEESSIRKEPKIALIAKENGLALYKQLLLQTAKIIPNKQTTMFFEIDPDQTDSLTAIIKQTFPPSKIEIKKDLAGLDRILKISI